MLETTSILSGWPTTLDTESDAKARKYEWYRAKSVQMSRRIGADVTCEVIETRGHCVVSSNMILQCAEYVAASWAFVNSTNF